MPPAGTEPWRSFAFGIVIEGDFPAPGLPPSPGPPDAPVTRVALASGAEIAARWGDRDSTRLLEERFDDAPEPARTIDHAPGVGYRLFARHFGLALVEEDGHEVLCAPPAGEPWSWQRFLVGRILPWAALLRGLEVFHASAVSIGEGAVALIGPTGAGKTSLAAQLVLRGASFMTDDVLAMKAADGDVHAYPGAAIVSVRPAEREAMGLAALGRLGHQLGHSGKTYVEVDRAAGAVPVRGIYFLAPGSDAAGIEEQRPTDPRLLLGSTFIESVQTPARLRNQLDLCAEVAASVPCFTLPVEAGVGAAELAERLEEHARSRLAA
jgi:hypothetical protein